MYSNLVNLFLTVTMVSYSAELFTNKSTQNWRPELTYLGQQVARRPFLAWAPNTTSIRMQLFALKSTTLARLG